MWCACDPENCLINGLRKAGENWVNWDGKKRFSVAGAVGAQGKPRDE